MKQIHIHYGSKYYGYSDRLPADSMGNIYIFFAYLLCGTTKLPVTQKILIRGGSIKKALIVRNNDI